MASRTGQEINMLAAEILLKFRNDKIEFNDGMAVLSMALMMSAREMNISKKDFVRKIESSWDIIAKNSAQSTH